MDGSGLEALVEHSWIFTHGLAMLVSSGSRGNIPDETILRLLRNSGEAFYLQAFRPWENSTEGERGSDERWNGTEGQGAHEAVRRDARGRSPLVLGSGGLAVESRVELHEMLRALRRDGTTIVLSTHDMAEAEKLCDRIGILIAGRLAIEGSPGQITAAGDRRTRIRGVLVHRTRGFDRRNPGLPDEERRRVGRSSRGIHARAVHASSLCARWCRSRWRWCLGSDIIESANALRRNNEQSTFDQHSR